MDQLSQWHNSPASPLCGIVDAEKEKNLQYKIPKDNLNKMLDWLQNYSEPEAHLTQYMKHATHFYIENGGFRKKILH